MSTKYGAAPGAISLGDWPSTSTLDYSAVPSTSTFSQQKSPQSRPFRVRLSHLAAAFIVFVVLLLGLPSFHSEQITTIAECPQPHVAPPDKQLPSGKSPSESMSRKVSSDSMAEVRAVDLKTHQLVDVNGNTRVFRGMSVAYKAPPFLPDTDAFHPVLSFAEEDIRLFQRLGLNLIRLAVPWAAVQPKSEDHWDEEYLANVVKLVNECAKYGIYVLIEAHQDLYAQKFCGNGMPHWSISRSFYTLPFPLPMGFPSKYDPNDPNGFPDDDTCGACKTRTRDDWGVLYASDAVRRAFMGLYTEEKIQAAFAGYWKKVAQTFGTLPNVLGYELLNEPFVAASSTATVPLALYWRSKTESSYLVPLYNRLVAAIRSVDSNKLIFWEPATGAGADSGNGFKEVPGGKAELGKSVFSWHSYGPNSVDTETIEEATSRRAVQTKKWGAGSMLSEFDCEFARGLGRIKHVMELADKNLLNWIGWQYKEFIHVTGSPPSGTLWDPSHSALLRPSMLHLFSRPYPISIAGELHSHSFDMQTNTFSMSFTPTIGLKGNTTIYINRDEDAGWSGEWVAGINEGEGVDETVGLQVMEVEGNVVLGHDESWKEGKKVTFTMKLSKADV